MSTSKIFLQDTQLNANVWTHRFGYLLSIGLLVELLRRASSLGSKVFFGCLLFGAAATTLYLASAAYHSLAASPNSARRELLLKFDHAAIFFLIAATHTACMLVLPNIPINIPLLIAVVSIGIGGIILKIFHARDLEILFVILDLVHGWLGVLVIGVDQLLAPDFKISLLIAGGCVYTVGVLFYLFDRIPFFHAVWHLFVLTASVLHFSALFVAVSELSVP